MISKKFRLLNKKLNKMCEPMSLTDLCDKMEFGLYGYLPMQYTGCKDCNGVEVYEGDVIESIDSEGNQIHHLVSFRDGSFVFVNKSHSKYFNGFPTVREGWVKEFDKKVVGNIYENPELNVWHNFEDFVITSKEKLKLTMTTSEPDSYNPIMGGDPKNPTWDEYISDYNDDFKPHIELIKEAIIQTGMIGAKAMKFAEETYFIFSDGSNFAFSLRGWGDLMQAIVNKRQGYMEYY